MSVGFISVDNDLVDIFRYALFNNLLQFYVDCEIFINRKYSGNLLSVPDICKMMANASKKKLFQQLKRFILYDTRISLSSESVKAFDMFYLLIQVFLFCIPCFIECACQQFFHLSFFCF